MTPKLKNAGALPAMNPLDSDPDITAARTEVDGLRERYNLAEARRTNAITRARGAKPKRSTLDRAHALMAGGTIPSVDPLAEIAAADEEMDILSEGIAEARQRLGEVTDRKSYELAGKLRGEYGSRLHRVSEALAALWGTVSDVLDMRNAVTAAGYALPSHMWPMPIPPAVWALGNTDQFSSLAAQYKRALAAHGF